jgi:MinD-like ATPase involved in chromosome partitioning or flagellar assembly
MLIAIGSWRGSPGATTAALALAEAWPTDAKAYVAECDPRGGTLVTRFLMPGPRRLAAVAGQARRGGDLSLLDQYAATVPSGIRVLTGPEDGRQLRAALNALLAPAGIFEQAANDSQTALIADVGRIDSDLPETASLLLLADALVLVARPLPDQILSLAAVNEQARRLHPNIELLLVGPGYPAEHVAELLRLPVLGQLPLVPTGAAAVWDRLTRRDSFRTAAALAGRTVMSRVAREIPIPRPASHDVEAANAVGELTL